MTYHGRITECKERNIIGLQRSLSRHWSRFYRPLGNLPWNNQVKTHISLLWYESAWWVPTARHVSETVLVHQSYWDANWLQPIVVVSWEWSQEKTAGEHLVIPDTITVQNFKQMSFCFKLVSLNGWVTPRQITDTIKSVVCWRLFLPHHTSQVYATRLSSTYFTFSDVRLLAWSGPCSQCLHIYV